LSKYFSRAKEKKNNEKTEINTAGINVNKEKNAIYFLLAFDPFILISSFNAFLISINMMKKNISNKITLLMSNVCRLNSLSLIKLLSIKVKNVKKPTDKVIIDITTKNIFFLINLNIM
jgi:hypothetical protein